jgi:hypothetical protein
MEGESLSESSDTPSNKKELPLEVWAGPSGNLRVEVLADAFRP